MDIDIDSKIISEKKKLRVKSKDFIKNFKNIENYIKAEVQKIEDLKKLKKPIIPEIKFKNISNKNDEIIRKIKQRGCIIIREVFDKKIVNKWNENLEDYIDKNNFFEDQKKKMA